MKRDRKDLRSKYLAAKLLAIRKKLGVSQTGMKRLLQFEGAYGRISEYERGTRFPPVLVLLAYSNLAGVTINDLVDDKVRLSD
jgi:transcriptional regulator with XRE-family HTH domain